jgi:hypothetical protein
VERLVTRLCCAKGDALSDEQRAQAAVVVEVLLTDMHWAVHHGGPPHATHTLAALDGAVVPH